jgi:hypothetical protein
VYLKLKNDQFVGMVYNGTSAQKDYNCQESVKLESIVGSNKEMQNTETIESIIRQLRAKYKTVVT